MVEHKAPACLSASSAGVQWIGLSSGDWSGLSFVEGCAAFGAGGRVNG